MFAWQSPYFISLFIFQSSQAYATLCTWILFAFYFAFIGDLHKSSLEGSCPLIRWNNWLSPYFLIYLWVFMRVRVIWYLNFFNFMVSMFFGRRWRYSANRSNPTKFADVGLCMNDNRVWFWLFSIWLYLAFAAILVVNYNIIGGLKATC